ncbi:MAG TPA: hypothetical protein VJC05_02515 [Candidatus Andersenbacteria bacterium]|nr:MAG: hypothetical protein A2854_01845 [Parcubacteria group bacterium RIFCSPHIGHO2_01_FULL_56_18]HLD25889.1 hypothetical protein [Candidatus Andersenbacteria bacterium]
MHHRTSGYLYYYNPVTLLAGLLAGIAGLGVNLICSLSAMVLLALFTSSFEVALSIFIGAQAFVLIPLSVLEFVRIKEYISFTAWGAFLIVGVSILGYAIGGLVPWLLIL